jgi:hypothetical protein
VSYEYSAASDRFEIPNPYRLENIALCIAGGVAGAGALYLLVTHRMALTTGDVVGIKAIAVGFVLLVVALATLGKALSQLRYLFGRGRPENVYGHKQPQVRANMLKENLRQNSLAYAEPQGAINGLLHHAVDTLIFAPTPIRLEAERQAANLLLTLAILIGLGVGYFFYPDPAIRSWIAAVFLAVLAVKLLKPMKEQEQPKNGPGLIVLLIVLPIVGPPVLAMFAQDLPDIERFELGRTLIISLIVLLVSQALFFLSLLKQLPNRPTINVACEQRTLTMNANPAKLFEELERTLQSRWTEKIPNRQYALTKVPDMLSGQSGSFEAEIVEETQPIPVNAGAQTIGEQLENEANRLVALLTGLALVTFLVAVYQALRLAQAPADAALAPAFGLSIVLLFTALYCWRCGHLLWGRVDFSSLLLWVEVRGSYEESQSNLGNQMTTAMSSSKKVINVESMTLRVWAAELDTVIFHKNGLRDVIGMRGRTDMAAFYADHLENFGRSIASVIAPSSNADLERIARMAQAQQLMGPPLTPVLAAVPTQAVAHAPAMTAPAYTAPPTSAAQPRRCSNASCGYEPPANAAFCPQCGTRLAS